MKELFNHSRMSVSRMFGIISGLLSLILMILVSVPAMGQLAPDKSKMQEQMNEMTHPVFIKNDGQVKDLDGNLLPNVLYLMNSSGMKVQLRPNGFSYDTWVHVWESSEVSSATKRRRPAREKDSADQAQIKETRYHRVDVNFQGANPNPVLEALEPVEESISYINGTMEMEIRQYRRIVYREVYPGIDVEFVASGNAQLPVEYNFIVKPGANPSLIALDYQGANAVELKNGKINLTLAHGTLEENIPASWLDNHSENVAVSYVSKGGTAIGFQVAGYDNTRQLTIDPTPRLVFGTFYQRPGAFVSDGNENNEFTYGDVDVDSNGNTYLSGKGRVNLFTTTAGAFQTTKASPTNGSDFIIAKFDNKGQRLAATYYGGTGSEFFIKIACAADAFYVAFITESANLGTLNNFVGASDILVAKMNPNLKQRYWARYVGGTDYEREIEITADKDGNAVLVGETQSPDYPYAGGLPSDNTNDVKLVITKLSSSGSLIFSGVIGKAQGVPDGNVVHLPLNLKTDATGAIFLAGNATLYDVPNSNAFNNYVTSGAYQTQVPVKPGFDNGYIDSYFLMKFNANGVKQWGTWIGGVYYEYDDIRLSLDKSGFPWVAFITTSTFPLTADAYQPELPGTLLADAATLDEGDFYKTYLQKYSRDGDSLLYSSTYEPNSFLFPFTCAFDIDTSTNDIYLEIGYFISPEGTSEDLVSNCAYQGSYIVDEAPSFNGVTTVAKYSNAGKTREWSSLLPVGVGGELAFRAEKLFVADFIRSNRNPQYLQDVTTPGVYQETPFRKNGFLLRCMDEGVLPNGVTVSSSSISPATQTACSGGLTQPILGNKVDLTGPPDYTNGILYQWQIASTSTGPWQNITGETGRNLTPEPQTAGPWYFRRLTQLAGPACDKITLDSSNVAELLISTNIAPRAKASGPKFYTCLGNPITLDGSASGGTPPYTYEWYIGGNTLPNSTETNLTDTPEETTLYTFKIIDAIGCFSIDQVSVEPVIADAGPDLPFCEGTAGVRLGGVPVQGAMEVNYGWSPATNLSCTACPNPVATPTVPTTYTLTVTVLEKSGMTCTMTDEVDVNVVSQPAANFAGPDVTVCQGETATIGLPAASGFSYTWASGQYIVDNRQAQTTYDAGTNVVAVPLIYSSTAEKDGCVFVDFMKVYTEYFQITPRNLNLCEGPFWFKQEAEAGEVNSPDAVYTWEKVSGDAQIEVLATRNNGADAYIRLKPGTGNSVTFRRKIELNGHVCYSFQNTLAVCAGGGGGGCYAEVRVLGGSGCPLPGGGYKVYAKNVDPNDYKFKWSPSWAFNNDTLAVPTLITANNGVNISVIATNRWASNIQCVDTLYVNDPALTLPIFSVSDTFMCPNQSIGIGRPFVQGYSYLWYNTKGMANPDFDKYISDPIITLANNESYVIRVEDIGTGCFVFDTMQVVVSPVKVDAGPDLQVCSGAVVTIGAEPEAGTNFTYSWNPSNVPWQNNTNATSPMPSLLFGGSNLTMVVTATDPLTNCSILDTVLLTAPAGGPLPSLATPAPICPGSSAMIGVTPVEGAVYSWSPTTDLSCATCAMTTASPTSTTTYTLSVSGCGPTVTASVTVTVLPAPDFTLTNKEICPSSPMGIGIGASGNTGSLSNVQSYSWSPAEGLSCTDCANPNAGPSSPTTYSLEVTYTNGCKTTKTCTITPPAGLTANAGVNKSICPGEEVTIGSDPASGVTYSWSPSTGLSSSTVSNPTASPSSTTNYTVTLTKGGCTATDQVLVTVKALPEINITGNTTICRGGETTIGTSSVPNIAYQWAPTTGVEDPNKATSIVRPVANTKYKLIQTNLNTGCTSFKEVQVIVNEPNFSIDASAPAPLEVCQGTAITLPLELTPSNTNCVFFWAPTPGLNNAFVQNPVATPMTNTTYRLEVTNLDNNCILTAYVPVTVVPLELCTGNEFGDVPVALEKSSAGYHKRTTKLKIGLNTDSELGPQSVYPGSISDGDDTNGDDEDGLGTLPNLHPSTTSFETVVSSVMNTEYASAYMAGWIDFNRDNCFDDNERTPVQYIPKDTLGAPPVELVWSGFNPSGELPFGKIYMRLRLTADDRDGWAQQPSANGYRRSGEVEDYCMRVYQSNAYPDSKVANTGDNAVGDLSTNDDMPPGTKYLSPTVMGTNPSAAMPVVDMNGTFTFSATVPGVYNYLVPVFDGVVTEQIKLTITVLNPAVVSNPVLGTDNAITVVNTPVMLNTLANDFAGGLLSQLNPSSVTITVAPLHGVAVVDTATGKIMYTPNAGYVGSDTYTYSVGDDSSPVRTATGCQFIQVIPENCENTVFASNDQVCAIAGFKNRGNVLDNDMDAEGDQIYAVPMTVTTADYTFMLNADGSYMLQTSNDYTDPIVINYAINDDQFYPQGRDTAMLCFYLKSAIGNLVWDDKDRDGVQDSLEMGVANATVTMHTCSNGTPGAALPDYTVTTDEFGVYAFPVPAVGSYALRFDYSSILNGSKYKFSIPNIEFNGIDTLDSDANMTTGFTGCFEVVNSSSVTHLDAGIFLDADGDYQPDCFDSDTLIIDPLGYFYCENTGEILNGGSISVTGPGNIYMIFDGTSGFYQFLVDASGLYTIAVTNPGGYVSSEDCVVEDDTLDAGGITLVVGSDDADGDDFLDDYTCPANTFYYHMLLSPGDYIVNNNFPMSCLDLGDLPTGYPTLVANDGPSHAILQHPLVFLGDTVDVEGNGQPDIMAGMMSGGDDAPTATSPDDEDGIAVLPALVITQDAPVIVKVNNLSAKDAKLVGFLDLNADFDFDDAGEMQSSNVQAGYSGNDTLTFSVPVDAAVGSKVGLRLRLSTECENSVPPPPPGPVPVTSFDGSIDLTDPKFSRPFSPGNNSLACNENAPPGNNYYDLYEFTVSANGTYVFDASGAPGDTYAILSETPFDPLQPCAKFIKTGNNESDQDPVITANLVAGVNYSLRHAPTTSFWKTNMVTDGTMPL
ncbi:MAG: GEVED domain-containing protein [Saprospiraceae bacterium]|nr:GEVED domain-containing protein [Saprospiraceae bacterium]